MTIEKRKFIADILLLQEARKACEGRKTNREYYFTCPLCGGVGKAKKFMGRHGVLCMDCGAKAMT